jgi:hypothetical protein
MLNHLEHDLIATYEELHRFPESHCIMEYFGDMSLHVVKDNVPNEKVIQRLNEALNEIQLTREQFNAIADEERFIFRINIIDYFKKHSKRNLQ